MSKKIYKKSKQLTLEQALLLAQMVSIIIIMITLGGVLIWQIFKMLSFA